MRALARVRVGVLSVAFLASAAAFAAPAQVNLPVQTFPANFRQLGTQPFALVDAIPAGMRCATCHSNIPPVEPIQRRWAASMHAQATRDPIFSATLAIAEQDARYSGDLCLRCHSPNGWLAAVPPRPTARVSAPTRCWATSTA